MTKHPFHIVDYSPWPFTASLRSLLFFTGLIRWIHNFETFIVLWKIGFVLLLLTMWQWWRDIRREGTFQGKHSQKVELGLRMGMILFIIREICFFFAFFWAFFHSSLSPGIEIGSVWPPKKTIAIKPLELPLLNTILLLSSGSTMTWAHIAIMVHDWYEAAVSIGWTVILGFSFTGLQMFEYLFCSFTMADSVYGRTFYIATGFHGFHVVLGAIFISIVGFRHCLGHFSGVHHFGLEARAWYWHFVDVVWLKLFLSLYWWGF